MKRWLLTSMTVGLFLGFAVGMYYGMAFLMNRSTSVYVSPGFAMVRFSLSPLQQVTLSRGSLLPDGSSGPDTIRVTELPSWHDRLIVKVSRRDEELSGIAEYSECVWRWTFWGFQFITTCAVKRGSLPPELRQAIQRGRELLATAYPSRER